MTNLGCKERSEITPSDIYIGENFYSDEYYIH